MLIAIPTFMRENNQKCYNSLPDWLKPSVHLFTHSGREVELEKFNPTAKIITTGNRDGIADVRQGVCDWARDIGYEKVLIIDDGCTFKVRDGELKLNAMTDQDWRDMLSMVEEQLDTYMMVGISDRVGNNRVPEDIKEIGRSYSCYGINLSAANDAGVTFDGMWKKNPEIKLYEDFYFILKMLTSGHKNAIIFKYAFTHAHGQPGGNSTIRNNSLQKKCIESLMQEFPGLVKLVKKENPSWKAGIDDADKFRWEVEVSWLAAYERGNNDATDIGGFFS